MYLGVQIKTNWFSSEKTKCPKGQIWIQYPVHYTTKIVCKKSTWACSGLSASNRSINSGISVRTEPAFSEYLWRSAILRVVSGSTSSSG